MKRKILALTAFFILVFVLVACNSEKEKENNNGKLVVYTTIYPLKYFIERVGSDLVSVESIVPPGSDAHSVEIDTKTMVKLVESDAFVQTGTGLEAYADSVAEAVKNENVSIVNATEKMNFKNSKETETHSEEGEEHNEEKEEDHDEHGEDLDIDPHVWLDPKRAIVMAENIKNALVELQPNNKDEFEKNFSTLKNELEDLNSEFENMVNESDNKTFIVSHSAYGYWEDAYGLKQIGISGLSPTDEPSQKQMVDIIDTVKKDNIEYIFFEENVTNKIAEIVKNEAGVEALTLQNLESITDENIKNDEDYFVIMRQNIEALKKALN
ncbi:adhesin [Bacillus sp. RJGP41]|nr:adhesin [Bacillus sp. RJGP41]